MPTDHLRLLLAEIEAEVVEEALDLYLRARPTPVDRRFDYRYRAAQAVLGSLRQDRRNLAMQKPDGDPDAIRADTDGLDPRRTRLED